MKKKKKEKRQKVNLIATNIYTWCRHNHVVSLDSLSFSFLDTFIGLIMSLIRPSLYHYYFVSVFLAISLFMG